MVRHRVKAPLNEGMAAADPPQSHQTPLQGPMLVQGSEHIGRARGIVATSRREERRDIGAVETDRGLEKDLKHGWLDSLLPGRGVGLASSHGPLLHRQNVLQGRGQNKSPSQGLLRSPTWPLRQRLRCLPYVP